MDVLRNYFLIMEKRILKAYKAYINARYNSHQHSPEYKEDLLGETLRIHYGYEKKLNIVYREPIYSFVLYAYGSLKKQLREERKKEYSVCVEEENWSDLLLDSEDAYSLVEIDYILNSVLDEHDINILYFHLKYNLSLPPVLVNKIKRRLHKKYRSINNDDIGFRPGGDYWLCRFLEGK